MVSRLNKIHSGSAANNLCLGVSSPTGDELWQDFFSDPSQWWDNRFNKRSSRSPDFRNKRTKEGLWIKGWSSPSWVEAQLAAIIQGQSQCGEVRALCMAGRLKEALRILNKRGISADSYTYVCLLQECIKKQGLTEGKQVHTHIVRTGFRPNIILFNNLVNMYVKCGSLEDAREVFDEMPDRDTSAWNIMIAGYAKHFCGREALEIYEKMVQKGVALDKVTFTCVLKACASLGALEKGREVHVDIIKAGIAPDIILDTALAAMYAQCGSFRDAHQVFDNMAERNVVSWNAMITGYSQHACGKEALEMYEQMTLEGVTPDQVTYVCILNVCASLAALEKGREVHAGILEAGIPPNVILENALADMYAKSGSLRDARQVFDNMAQRNVVSWNVMITGYAQRGCGMQAFEMYRQMVREGVPPDKVTFIYVLNACASLGALEKGKEVHCDIIKAGIPSDMTLENALVDMYAKCGSLGDAGEVFDNMAEQDVVSWNAMIAGYAQDGCGREAFQLVQLMRQEGLNPNVVSWSAVIAGYAQHGCGREALEIYEQMVQEGVIPNNVTGICVLKACASLGALGKGKEVHADIVKAGIVPDILLETTLVDMYAKSGSLRDAQQVFDNMAQRNVVSWSAMIAGYAENGCGRKALQLFEEMQQEGFKPDGITFMSVLSACSHVGLVDEGHHYFDSIGQEHGLNPTVEHLGCMVDLLGRAGLLEEAEDFINKTLIEADAEVWLALLGACRTQGNVEVAERAAKSLLKCDSQHPSAEVPLARLGNKGNEGHSCIKLNA